MAFSVFPNIEVFGDGALLWQMKQLLVAQGWSVAGSGDGTTYSAAGDVHAPGGPYAGSLDIANAWFRLRAPATMTVRRELLFQRPNTTASVWRVWYSSDGTGFTGGTPSATVRPTAADEQGIYNTPSGTAAWWPNAGVAPFKIDMMIGDAAEQHSFFMGIREFGDNIYRGGIGIDVLTEANALDVDPAVVNRLFAATSTKGTANEWFRATTPFFGVNNTVSTNGNQESYGWYRKGLSGALFVPFGASLNGVFVGSTSLNDLGDQRFVGQDSQGRTLRLPLIYGRSDAYTTQRGYKGRSRIFRYEMLAPIGLRLTKNRARVVAGCVSLPWDGSSDLVI